MARKVSVSFAGSAVSDLEEIRAYYTEQDVPDVGERLIAEIISKIENLSEYPDRGRVVPEFDLEYLRELIHPPFRIVYRRDSNKVRIVRVWRSERLLKLPEAS
ncbi:MAG: plasmid stabilization system protein [Deltaproteobacteria bacterium]|nr:plasmid stabilization system protein [Deltaproteobacteria bacterium]